MRALFAAVLLLHGLAHLVGFLVPWRIIPASPQTADASRLFGGRFVLPDALARGFGVVWLLVAVTFGFVAIAWWRRQPASPGALLAIVLVSLVLTAVWWPAARVGFMLNVAILLVLALMTFLAYRREIAVARTASRLSSVMVTTAAGRMEYAAAGTGPAVLSIHGTGGGWDQGLSASRALIENGFRVIAPSRFGYLRTPMPADASPAAEADAFAALLDSVQVKRAAVISFSAGAAPALQFALRHPDRVSALILVVPAAGGIMPPAAGGPPAWVMNVALRFDFPMWLMTRYMPRTTARLMAVPWDLLDSLDATSIASYDSTVRMLLPISTRRAGLLMDARNQGGAARDYPLERITVPTLLVSAEDDLYATMHVARQAAARIPGAQLIGYPSGGHLLLGRQREAWPRIAHFIEAATRAPGASRAGSAVDLVLPAQRLLPVDVGSDALVVQLQ